MGLRVDRIQLSDQTGCEGVEGTECPHQAWTDRCVCRSEWLREVHLRPVVREVLRPDEGQSFIIGRGLDYDAGLKPQEPHGDRFSGTHLVRYLHSRKHKV